ncbi:MAG TPA: Asp-tRNA(Asn)/Glu-tRNA(Gln) amidotransferase subunit GatC [Candidatus Nanoarchaeia archaeon]|nr:Asp-tRNA(Asn)/Glu-tRNA(Gln) amidotransferase subunit GatC [Candidatus Nanoarchaeia archaeon]
MKGVKVDRNLILRVADNAKLSLTDKEIDEFLPQLKEVLEFFSSIDEVDTKGIEPSTQPVEIRNVLREDVVKPSLSQDDALANTEHKKDGYFKGPRAV